MVLSWLIVVFFTVSVAVGGFRGEISAVNSAMLEGATEAVRLAISLTGPICLWSALQNVMEKSGIDITICRLLSPLLRRLYPESSKDMKAISAIGQNLSANLLGLGNAATPMGIRAVKRMRELSGNDTASNEMCRLIVMNTASVQLIPATVAAARSSLGAPSPYAILPAVWMSSLCSVSVGLLAAKLMEGRKQ